MPQGAYIRLRPWKREVVRNAVIPVYGHHVLDNYQWATSPTKVKYIRLVRHLPANPGELYDDRKGEWVLSCPNCGRVGYLDHTVTILGDAITITPSIECPYDCGFHEVVTGWELRREVI
jgi:hypothetical protein